MTLAKVGSARHFLGLKGLSPSEIEGILDRAAYWERQGDSPAERLKGKFIVNLFFENSTRTRFSFEIAERRLGAEPVQFSAESSSMAKGETIEDTVRAFEAMGVEAGVIRLKPVGLLQQLAEKIHIPLINAGDGNNEHPTQALIDLYTLRKHFGELKGLKVAYIGDILHSRVARSGLWGLLAMGAKVCFCAPEAMRAPELEPYAPYVSMEEALQSDAVVMLRVQLERHTENLLPSREEYRSRYGLTVQRFESMPKHAIVLHPAPINRNVEIDDEVIEQERSKIFMQMKYSVPVRMAVLERTILN